MERQRNEKGRTRNDSLPLTALIYIYIVSFCWNVIAHELAR
jgi:hypothetical protein